MPKCRHAHADALARLLFDKPLAELDRTEQFKLDFLRTLPQQTGEESSGDTEAMSFETTNATYH